MISPVGRHRVLDGLDAVGPGRRGHRRVPQRNDGRGADDCLVTAQARQVVEDPLRPRITACFAARGGRRSATKTGITPLAQGVAGLGQTWWTPARRHGQRATRPMTPRQASRQALTPTVTTLCHHAAGATPEPLIATLHPVGRGWAHSPPHVSWRKTCATRDRFGWRRLSRWAQLRPPHHTGRWLAARSFPHRPGETWRVTDPTTGPQVIRVQAGLTPPRYLPIQGDAHPVAPQGEAYVPSRARPLALQASSAFRAQVLPPPHGRGPGCPPGRPDEASLARPPRDGHHHTHRLITWGRCHPHGQRQAHAAPDRRPAPTRPSRGAGHA